MVLVGALAVLVVHDELLLVVLHELYLVHPVCMTCTGIHSGVKEHLAVCAGLPKLIVLNSPSLVTMSEVAPGQLAMENGFATEGGGVRNGADLVPCPLGHNAPFYCAIQGVLSASHQVLAAAEACWSLHQLRLVGPYTSSLLSSSR